MAGQGSYLQTPILVMSSLSSFGVHTFLCCRVQQGSLDAERALLECSLVSLQAIQQAVGADSAQYRAASKVTMKLVQVIQTLLSNAYDGRYTGRSDGHDCLIRQFVMKATTVH